MKRSLSWRIFFLTPAALAFFALVANTGAQTVWTGGVGFWDVPENWSAGVPGSGDSFAIDNGGTAQFPAGIDGLGGLGTLGSLLGTSGSLSVDGGSLTLTSDLRIGDEGTGHLTVSDTGEVSADAIILGRLATGDGTLTLTGGMLSVGQISKGAGAGTVTLNGGTVQNTGAQADFFSGLTTIYLDGSGGTIDTQSFDVTTEAGFEGDGGLIKKGAGTFAFGMTSASTYTGTTTVEAGMLQVDGFITSDVVVKSGATLGGDGIVGAITLESGATLIPIDCFDADSLLWEEGATMVFGIGDMTGNILEISGAFTKEGDGPFAFTFQDYEWQVGQEYALVFFGTTDFVESDFSFTNGGGFAGTFNLDETSLRFTLTAVPEPSTGALALAGLLGAFAFRSRLRARPPAIQG